MNVEDKNVGLSARKTVCPSIIPSVCKISVSGFYHLLNIYCNFDVKRSSGKLQGFYLYINNLQIS